MSDILSQQEIDDLMKALMSGESNVVVEQPTSRKTAKPYNFARPSKFNKDHLRTFEIIFDNYARLLSSFLTGYLRTATNIEVAASEALTYSEFHNSLANPVILGILTFAPLKGSVVLELSSNIGYSIIDRILGGSGTAMKKMRDFSEIEKILIERVLGQMILFLTEPWENVIDLNPKLDKLETNSQFAQIISPNEMIALTTLSIRIGSVEGVISYCVPHIVIESVMDRLNTKFWFTSSKDSEEESYYHDQIEEELEKTKVPIRAVVGRTTITVNDFISLQVGDIIPLDSYTNSDFNILVGNLLKFRGKPGVNRGKNAIQITSLVRREDQ